MSDKKTPFKIPSGREYTQDRGSSTPDKDAQGEKDKVARYGRFSRWPAALKSGLLKWWVAGAACYFIAWGLLGMSDELDTAAVIGIVIGLFIDFIIYPVLRATDGPKKDIHKYILFDFPIQNKTVKHAVSLLCSSVYSVLICLGVLLIYGGINVLLQSGEKYFGVEPILFGLFYIIFDFIILGLRQLIFLIIKRKKVSAKEGEEDV